MEDGAIPSKWPVSPDDIYLGRITAKSVAPPHTVASLKRRLCSVENINDDTYSSLFAATSTNSPLDDTGRVSILTKSGPGSMQHEPVALVVKLSYSMSADEDIFPLASGISSPKPSYCKHHL